MSTSDAFDHAVRNAGKNTNLSQAQLDLIGNDFEGRFFQVTGCAVAISDEWRAYLRDIGSYGNFPSYVAALEAQVCRDDLPQYRTKSTGNPESEYGA